MKEKNNGASLTAEDHAQDKSGGTNVSGAYSRRLFLRTLGFGAAGLAFLNKGFSENLAGGALGSSFSPLADTQKHYYGHDAVLDQYGVIAPWYKEPNGQCDFRVRIAAETLKRYPWTTEENAIAVYPHYVFTGRWKISSEGRITPRDPEYWNGDLGQRSTNVLKGMVEYYRYSGDPAAIAHLTYMADYLIDHCLTPADHPWPEFLISVPTKGKAYGKADPKGMIQLDICGSMAEGVLRAYQLTGNKKYLDAAQHWGDLFAEKCQLDPAVPPWPRYADPENIDERWKNHPQANVQTGGVTMILAFLDELIRMGYTGKNDNIVQARDAGINYLREHLLPKWTKDDTWAYYFWDWLNYTQNCSTTADVAAYIMKNKTRFPNWRNDVRNMLTIFLNRSSANPVSGGDVYNGAWAYPESSSCCDRSLWYAPLMDGAIMTQYGIEAGDDWAREMGYRQMILQTYDAHETGVSEDNIDGGVYVNDTWFNIAHPWPLLWVLHAMSSLPEELGASRENHLIRSSAVVNSIVYGKGKISYTTFDAPPDTIDILRLSFEPKKITADGRKLKRRDDLDANGYLVKNLPNGDTIIRIRHDGAKNIIVTGRDPQTLVQGADLTYEGNWTQKKGNSSSHGSIHSSDEEGASVSVTFQGNQVRLIGRADPSGGLADVFIDGEKQIVPVDFWNPVARDQQILYYKNGLGQGVHTLKIVARGKGNFYSRGGNVYIDAVQFSSENERHSFPSGKGSTAPQRMIFGYTNRQDYKDEEENLWRPATEVVTRLERLADTVATCWWMDPVDDTISDTADPELYRYGYHANEFWLNLTVGPAKYDVRLKFAAIRGIDTGKNTFDIFINQEKKVSELDVTATAGGRNKAVDLLIKDITPMNGIIEVRFKANDPAGEAFVQALEVGQNLKDKGAIHVPS